MPKQISQAVQKLLDDGDLKPEQPLRDALPYCELLRLYADCFPNLDLDRPCSEFASGTSRWKVDEF